VKLALVTTPWDGSGESDAAAAALAARLAERVELAVFVERGREGTPALGRPTLPADTLVPREHDHVLYSIAPDPAHGFMLPMLRRIGGTAWLHDWVLLELALGAHPRLAKGGWRALWIAAREGGLAQARRYAARERELAAGRPFARDELPLQRGVVRFADAFVVAGERTRERILEDRNAPTPIAVVPHGVELDPGSGDAGGGTEGDARRAARDRGGARAALGWPAPFREAFVVTTAGAPGLARAERDLAALAVARSRGLDVRWAVLADGGGELERLAAARGLADAVHRVAAPHGASEAARTTPGEHLRAGDVELAAEGRTAPGTRANVARALGCGRAVIVEGEIAGEFRSPAVLRLADRSPEALAERIVALAEAPGRRAELEREAFELAERELDWRVVARAIVEHLGRFPHARAARKSLIGAQLARARDARNLAKG
jgi:glycosyltransferase involved in cell wall biosynthesis